MNRLLACFALCAVVTPAHAHHSIVAIYDSAKPVTLDAVVVDFQFVNPHPFVTAETADRTGRPQQWRLEMDNRHELSAVGMSADTFKKGDRISVTGGLARDGS